MFLAGDGCGQSAGECIDDWRVAAGRLARLFEGLLHQCLSVIGKHREVLLAGEWVVTGTKQVFGDLSITVWLAEAAAWRVALDTADGTLVAASAALGSVHLLLVISQLLHVWLLTVVVLLVRILSHHLLLSWAKVHQCLHSLLALRWRRLELVVRAVNELTAGADELTELSHVDVDHGSFGEELASDLEDVAEHGLERALIDIDTLGNASVRRLSLNVRLDAAEVSMFGFVLQPVGVHEVVGQLDVRDTHVVTELLVADDAEAGNVDGATFVKFGLRPLGERLPTDIVGRFGDDGTNSVGVAAEVSLDGLVAETRNIEVKAGGLLPM